jgi:hypothetical protein
MFLACDLMDYRVTRRVEHQEIFKTGLRRAGLPE